MKSSTYVDNYGDQHSRATVTVHEETQSAKITYRGERREAIQGLRAPEAEPDWLPCKTARRSALILAIP